MSNNEKKNYWIEIIGILVAIGIIYVWYDFFHFNDGEPWEKRGQMGDSFGVLNTLFSGLAFAGIVFTIFLQKKELGLQRNELKLTREEFTTNRLTNILYQQINIQQKAISEFKINTFAFDVKSASNPDYSGNSAFLYLYKKLSSFITPSDDERTKEQLLADKVAHYTKHLVEYVKHEEAIIDFSARTSNSVRVLKNILAKSDLNTNEMKQFVDLFYDNIGYYVIHVMNDIVETFHEYIHFDITEENYIDYGRMSLAYVQLKNVIKLKNLVFDRDRNEVVKDLLE